MPEVPPSGWSPPARTAAPVELGPTPIVGRVMLHDALWGETWFIAGCVHARVPDVVLASSVGAALAIWPVLEEAEREGAGAVDLLILVRRDGSVRVRRRPNPPR